MAILNEGMNHLKSRVAAKPPASCAALNPITSTGRIPAKVLLTDRAMVTAGLAKDVDAVNRYRDAGGVRQIVSEEYWESC